MAIKEGIHYDLSVKDYRALPAINYSSLAAFNESQDHALMEVAPKSHFEFGNAFELVIEDRVKGTKKFGERFFTCEAPGEMPTDLAEWIESDVDLETKYRRKQDGGLHGGSQRLHDWLDECRAHPGAMPMGTDQLETLSIMADNFLKMQPFADIGNESTLAEILPLASFQVPIVWYTGKPFDGTTAAPGYSMRLKALLDCLIITESTVYIFDIKTAADMKRFFWMMRDKYWIQEVHYTVGAGHLFTGKNIVWLFLVSSKAAHYISQPYCIDPAGQVSSEYVDPSRYGNVLDKYSDLCDKYQAWMDEGRPPKGWKELEKIRIYIN